MTQRERDRLLLLVRVKERQISLRKASELMQLSYRQAKRVWRRYQQEGDAGLVHRLRDKPGGRAKSSSFKERVLKRYADRYGDFGPTLASEHLAQEGLRVDHETLRRWLLAKGNWAVTRRRQKHRQWRERKECVGEMVQMDGSDHDWFEGRRPRAVLMVMVDDASNWTYARFFEGETTQAAFLTFGRYARRRGLPQSLYVDRDSIYRTDREPTLEEQMAGKTPQTQFGRAMEKLGVKIILAWSPQAKGRVERRNGLFQDRLVKELRLKGISDLEAANAFLEKEFLPQLNRKFVVQAKVESDLHRPLPGDLKEILATEEKRVVGQDWTLRIGGTWLQIDSSHERLSLAGKEVVVRDRADGKRELIFRGEKLRWKKLPERPPRQKKQRSGTGPKAPPIPGEEHPWRRFGSATGQPFWRKQNKLKGGRQHFAAGSVAPSLRSGSTAPAGKVKPKQMGTFSTS